MYDWESVSAHAEKFIREQVHGAGVDGVVFGLSGGVDSAVTAHLCARALGADRCTAMMMPNSKFTPRSETDDGILVAKGLGIRHKVIQIGGISDMVIGNDTARDVAGRREAVGNLNARLRAALLYYEAQKSNLLVVGTDDRSEHMIGYFTKYGDGACDMLPIGDLYKTQVWDIARHLGVPKHIIEKEPSPHLWKRHSVSGELGIDYDTIDAVLSAMHDVNGAMPLDVDPRHVRLVMDRHRTSEHKRHMPPVADLMGPHYNAEKVAKNMRTWGSFERFTLGSYAIRIISINPDASLSLQYRSHGTGFWRAIYGNAVVALDNNTIYLKDGDGMQVKADTTYRVTAGRNGTRMLEISTDGFIENDGVGHDEVGRR